MPCAANAGAARWGLAAANRRHARPLALRCGGSRAGAARDLRRLDARRQGAAEHMRHRRAGRHGHHAVRPCDPHVSPCDPM
eukprot:6566181-Prymnesium_polylepis.1